MHLKLNLIINLSVFVLESVKSFLKFTLLRTEPFLVAFYTQKYTKSAFVQMAKAIHSDIDEESLFLDVKG